MCCTTSGQLLSRQPEGNVPTLRVSICVEGQANAYVGGEISRQCCVHKDLNDGSLNAEEA